MCISTTFETYFLIGEWISTPATGALTFERFEKYEAKEVIFLRTIYEKKLIVSTINCKNKFTSEITVLK